jgi:hypothetical protein
MVRSRFHSATDALAAAALAILAGCGGGGNSTDAPAACGPGDAPQTGLIASGPATLTYGQLIGGLNNDCPATGAPAGVISLTIAGVQTDGTGLLTLCVARPDRLAGQAQSLGQDVAGSEVRVVDLTGTASGCSFTLDTAKPVSGTATSTGLCQNGGDPAGFALTLDGTLSFTRTCGATVDSVQATVHGRVAVPKG